MINTKDLNTFIAENLFEKLMSSGSGVDGYSNYMGPDWAGWVCGPMQTRDSDCMERSNYRTALARLESLNPIMEEYEASTGHWPLETRSVSHWACGHFDLIMVKADCLPLIQELCDISYSLSVYPVLDEDDFSELENEQKQDDYTNNARELRKVFLEWLGFKEPDRDLREHRIEQLDAIVQRIYDYEQSPEEAWVSDQDIEHWLQSAGYYELPELAKDGNTFAKLLLARGLREAR